MMFMASACKDSGSVGDSIDPPNTDLKVDTTYIDNVEALPLNSFSGNKKFVPIGGFQDPLFGNVKARGLLRPRLVFPDSGVTVDQNTQMILRLQVDDDGVYGDTTARARFDVVEIGELWRGPAWHVKDDIKLVQGAKLGSFSINKQDSVDIALASSWVQKYGQYYNRTDSTRFTDYRNEFFGLALVSTNNSKIITVDPSESRFFLTNLKDSTKLGGTTTDEIRLADRAFSISRTNVSTGSDAITTYNTLENVLKFDFDFSSDKISPLNVANADLVFSRDNVLLNQAGSNVVRPVPDTLYLHLREGDELPLSIDPGTPISQGPYDKSDHAYHFNLTGAIINQGFDFFDSSFHFYLTAGKNNGIIRSDLIFNSQAGEKAPKLIITSTQNK